MEVEPGEEAPKPSLKKLGGAFVGLLQGHLELLGIEFQEEKARTVRLFFARRGQPDPGALGADRPFRSIGDRLLG